MRQDKGAYGGVPKGELPEPIKEQIAAAKDVFSSGWDMFSSNAYKVKSKVAATGNATGIT